MNNALNLDNLVDLHVTQDFDSSRPPDLGDFYTASKFFPNEIAYVIDCRTVDIEVINKVEDKVFKTRGLKINDIEDLYEVVHSSHLQSFFSLSYNMVKLVTDKKVIMNPYKPGEDIYYAIYKSRSGRMIMRRSFALSVNDKGALEYTAGFLSDVTEIFQGNHFHFYFEGPNSETIYCHMNQLNDFLHILSRREIEVLGLIGKGYDSKNIATKLNISSHTVNKHRTNIINSLETTNTITAYNKALDMGLMQGR